jgi:EAL domain-containing protein (putative c-di-GMP-specific phosphodiesterase class I)
LAEGIETEEQLEFISNIQCDHAQGYLFYKPLPADEIRKLLGESSG